MPGDFEAAYAALRRMLEEETAGMKRGDDPRAGFCVIAGFSPGWKREIWFGGVRTGKAYVSYHLFPVYMLPELMASVSPALRKRMQGMSCFNFTKVDPALFEELRLLTRRCREAWNDGTLEKASLEKYQSRKAATPKKKTAPGKKSAVRKRA